MFDLAKSSLFFKEMDKEHPTLVLNIDIVDENKRSLDASYHQPKLFILNLNNLLRSLVFFVENSIKNSPDWLRECVIDFRNLHGKEYATLKHLRDVSAHQKLIFPAESLSVGLFRISSVTEYKFKLGIGDADKPTTYAPDLALQNTEDIFDDLLTFPSIAFMDLEHSAFGECLGVTRRWFFKANFKFDNVIHHDIVDVYALASNISASLLDHVCISYAAKKEMQYEKRFTINRTAYNNINTLLELDLYPSLFAEWWDGDFEPLNFGVRADGYKGRRHIACDEYYAWIYKNLTKSPEEYKDMLSRFASLEPDAIFSEDHHLAFLSFITNNHWHFKRAFPDGFMRSTVRPSVVMMLQRYGKMLISEYNTGKASVINEAKQQLDLHISNILEGLNHKSN